MKTDALFAAALMAIMSIVAEAQQDVEGAVAGRDLNADLGVYSCMEEYQELLTQL